MSLQNYKYKASFVVGHKPDGKPIRKYIQDNSKAKFDAKVRALKALTDRGGTPNKFTVEQWAWQWYHTYKEPHIGASQRNTYEAHFRLRMSANRRNGACRRQAVPAAAAHKRGHDR